MFPNLLYNLLVVLNAASLLVVVQWETQICFCCFSWKDTQIHIVFIRAS